MANIISFLTSALWPATTLIFLYYFKQDISTLIGRLKLTKIAGNSFEFEINNQDSDIKNNIFAKELEDVPKYYESQSEILHTIKSKFSNESKFNTHCHNLLPLMILNYVFYKIYTNIFGTQIDLLHFLSALHQGKIEQLIDFYNKGKIENPEVYKSISFDAYIAFLINNGLVEKKEHYYNITVLGRDFLKFLNFENPPRRYL